MTCLCLSLERSRIGTENPRGMFAETEKTTKRNARRKTTGHMSKHNNVPERSEFKALVRAKIISC